MSGKKEGTKETPQQRALVELAMNEVADYKKRWLPVQQNLAQSIRSMGTEGSRERTQAKGVASTETEARFSRARGQLEGGLAQTGQLGSSKGKLAIAGLGEDQATSRGLGMGKAEQDIDDAYTAGLTSIMQMGRGEKGVAIEGVNRTAGLSGQRAAADAAAALGNRMGNAELVGQAVGLGGFYASQPGFADRVQARFSNTGFGSSGFGSGLAYGNRDLAGGL
ncbi:MAG: hypothetical protein KF863_21380 [Rubrivivax sp.]|nr:hypothetical protein [Rubrivivax sp.]